MTGLEIQRLLLDILPCWNYQIVKPFKQKLDKNISFEMYCLIKIIQQNGEALSLSRLSCLTRIPKQQITKLSDRLVKQEMVKRIYDPSDRRIIKLCLTDKGMDFLDSHLNDSKYFGSLLEPLTEQEYDSFRQSLELLSEVFTKLYF